MALSCSALLHVLERRINHRFRADLALAEVQSDLEAGVEPGPVTSWAM